MWCTARGPWWRPGYWPSKDSPSFRVGRGRLVQDGTCSWGMAPCWPLPAWDRFASQPVGPLGKELCGHRGCPAWLAMAVQSSLCHQAGLDEVSPCLSLPLSPASILCLSLSGLYLFLPLPSVSLSLFPVSPPSLPLSASSLGGLVHRGSLATEAR